MSLIRESSDQLRRVFSEMPMQSRLIAMMLVVAIAIGFGLLVRGSNVSNTDFLFGGRVMAEGEIDAVEIAFGQAGLNGWIREGHRIKVPSENRDEYLSALQDSAVLPLSLRSNVQQAIQESSVFESNEQRSSREMAAKEQDLGTRIAAFPDVRWATVEYDIGERFGLNRTRPQSASVVVQPEGTSPMPKTRHRMIQDLIRGAYAGMSPEDVVVIDTNATSSEAYGDDDDPMMRRRREAEAYYEQKIRSILSGYGPIRVAAYAEIDPTMDIEKTVLKYDEPTTLRSSQKKLDSQSNRPEQGGVPGAAPNANVTSNRATSLDNAESTTIAESERESSSVAGTQYENSRLASLQVRRVRVSIGLPEGYYQKAWASTYLRENPDSSAADIPALSAADLQQLKDDTQANIQSGVSQLLPSVDAGEDTFPLVEVWDFPDLPEPLAAEPETTKVVMTWLAHEWQSMALVGLALVALFVALSAAKKGGQSTPPEFAEGFGLELPAPPPELEEAEIGDADSMTITGGSLKDELVILVESNPEVAANVIRSWVGEAA